MLMSYQMFYVVVYDEVINEIKKPNDSYTFGFLGCMLFFTGMELNKSAYFWNNSERIKVIIWP